MFNRLLYTDYASQAPFAGKTTLFWLVVWLGFFDRLTKQRRQPIRDQDWFCQDGASSLAKSVPQGKGRCYSWGRVHIHPKQILCMLVDYFKNKSLQVQFRTSLKMQTLNYCCWLMGWGNFFTLKKHNHFLYMIMTKGKLEQISAEMKYS